MSIGTVSPATFEWIIPSVREVLQRGSNRRSEIMSPDFHLPDTSWYLSLYIDSTEWIHINLWRGDSGGPKTITYTIRIYDRTEVKEFTKTCYFPWRKSWSGAGRMIFEKNVASNSNLLITCNIKCDTPNVVTRKEFVTSAVQTEIANSVIEKEIPKDEDLSSLDMKDDKLLRKRMKELLIKGIDHDVTVCVQDKEFRAHRNILSARSPVFAMMLAHDTKENNTGTISIEDCDPKSFDEFMLYVYTGRTENLTPSNALQLYYPADKYDFPVLKNRCVSLLKTSMSVESICDVVLLAAKHEEKELLEVATEFFARNIKKILVTVAWQNFLLQNPVEANELYIKTMEILQPEN